MHYYVASQSIFSWRSPMFSIRTLKNIAQRTRNTYCQFILSRTKSVPDIIAIGFPCPCPQASMIEFNLCNALDIQDFQEQLTRCFLKFKSLSIDSRACKKREPLGSPGACPQRLWNWPQHAILDSKRAAGYKQHWIFVHAAELIISRQTTSWRKPWRCPDFQANVIDAFPARPRNGEAAIMMIPHADGIESGHSHSIDIDGLAILIVRYQCQIRRNASLRRTS